ncbi:MAG TPA: endoribonuclease MazF [Thermoanaerobaculia bacterium]|nr:endoribonuclease MazF [Thermoanaerobaculia bacterium]
MATKSGSSYVPERGDVVWLSFDPQAGHEQAGRRPAVILSPSVYNRSSGLAVVVPITSHVKGYPFEVQIPAGSRISGVILTDHLKSVDWRARKAERIGKLPEETLKQALRKAALLIAVG